MLRSRSRIRPDDVLLLLLLRLVHHPCADLIDLFTVAGFLLAVVFHGDAAREGAFVACRDSWVEVS